MTLENDRPELDNIDDRLLVLAQGEAEWGSLWSFAPDEDPLLCSNVSPLQLHSETPVFDGPDFDLASPGFLGSEHELTPSPSLVDTPSAPSSPTFEFCCPNDLHSPYSPRGPRNTRSPRNSRTLGSSRTPRTSMHNICSPRPRFKTPSHLPLQPGSQPFRCIVDSRRGEAITLANPLYASNSAGGSFMFLNLRKKGAWTRTSKDQSEY